MKKFLQTHTLKILSTFDEEIKRTLNSLPIDIFIKNYYRDNKGLGSHDRQIISENVFSAIRYKVFLDLISPKPVTWEKRIEMLYSKKFEDRLNDTSFPL